MTKSDLIAGRHVVRLRRGDLCVVLEDHKGEMYLCGSKVFAYLEEYRDNLLFAGMYIPVTLSSMGFERHELDIMDIYELDHGADICRVLADDRGTNYLHYVCRTRPKKYKKMSIEKAEELLGCKIV